MPEKEGQKIAEALDRMFRSNNTSALQNAAIPISPENPQPRQEETAEEELHQAQIDRYIENFINQLRVADGSRREIAHRIRGNFGRWKDGTVTALQALRIDDQIVNKVKGLTLTRVAQFTGQKFKEAREFAAPFAPGHLKYDEARSKVEYWNRVDDQITSAIDPD